MSDESEIKAKDLPQSNRGSEQRRKEALLLLLPRLSKGVVAVAAAVAVALGL
jgi:hypothetical protein